MPTDLPKPPPLPAWVEALVRVAANVRMAPASRA